MFNLEIQRVILWGALALVLVMIWQSWTAFQLDYATPPVDSVAAPDAPPSANPIGAADVPAAPQTPTESSTAVAPNDAPREVEDSAQLIRVETDVVRAEIDPRGGDLVRIELLRYPLRVDAPDEPFVLMYRSDEQLAIAQSGLIGNGREYPNHGVEYQARQYEYQLGDDSHIEVALDWRAPDGVAYQKVFRFARDSYRIEIDFRVDNQTDQAWSGFVYGQLKQTEIDQESSLGFLGRLPSFHGAAMYTADDKYDKISYANMRDDAVNRVTPFGWVAMMRHYFVSAYLPDDSAGLQFYTGTGGYQNRQYRIGYKTTAPVQIAAGNNGVLSSVLFVGPKAHDQLERQNVEGLLLTVDYGWLTPIADPLFWLLSKIHGFTDNWGWAIVLLTVLVKAVFYPLSAASYRSMAKMKKLAPRMKTLKERCGDDKKRFQQEMMKFYKSEKVNPAGGCLPILVQIPVFIALYWTLLESVELRQADFIFWINDLSIPDPYFVLPLLMGASMIVQFFLNPAPVDPLQKKIMMAMPVVFTVFFLWFPAGLVLYWVVNNLLSIAQQYYVTRTIERA